MSRLFDDECCGLCSKYDVSGKYCTFYNRTESCGARACSAYNEAHTEFKITGTMRETLAPMKTNKDMDKLVTNFARFYLALNKMKYAGDKDELKKQVVMQYTSNRTEHLHEMTYKEYDECCRGLENLIPSYKNSREIYFKEIKRKRSAVLHQMQLYGIDTSDWTRVDNFCLSPKIAGKKFRELDGDGLDAILVKLRIINRKKDNL